MGEGSGKPGCPAQGRRDSPPHHVSPEPGGDDDLALAHQLVLGPAPPAPKYLLDEGGQLGHALLPPPFQVEELGTAKASAGCRAGTGTPSWEPWHRPGAPRMGSGPPMVSGDPWGWHPLGSGPAPP